ncbi:ferredoxin [Methanocella sp. CWC-04]|uniref:Ferredoxin n=1 Tax=Methanooceanicella nereidis TaxID=2052831 RepID=A0AAP2RBH0_9EURY|nr:DUF2148 domain-containing protein [Methanocella sp. CWC-04]MCD1294263.1 ferredoxin [Methanocella sp. CWC-04]
MILSGNDMEDRAVETVAALICAAARTAPKAKGIDNLFTLVVTGDDIQKISAEMRRVAKEDGVKFFERDAGNVDASKAIVLFGQNPVQLNIPVCGYCGYANCAENAKGSNVCAVSAGDLGIALSSAAAVAAAHHIDNRMMFSIGRAALNLGFFKNENVRIAYGLPLSVSGKSPYFDRKQ